MDKNLVVNNNMIFILPPQPEKIVKVVIVDENRRTQYCNDCNNYSIYKCKQELDYCTNCKSKNIEINF